MPRTPSPLATVAALLVLFLGGGVVGVELAERLAPGSWLAQAVSLFALPFAFAAGLQAWYGLALFLLVPRLVRWLVAGRPVRDPNAVVGTPSIPGSFVFVPISSVAGGIAGLVTGLASPTHPAWVVTLAYWLLGTVHGLAAWRLARRGVLLPPESI